MTYSIFDAGNLVVSYDDAQAAQDALTRLAAGGSADADSLLLIAFDDTGRVVDEYVPGQHVLA